MNTTLLIALLVLVVVFAIGVWVAYRLGRRVEQAGWEREKLEVIRKARAEAADQSRGVLTGRFIEQLAPYLPEFKYDPTEARFIGSPIDLVVFPGLAQKDPQKVVFIEVKTGKRRQLEPVERKVRELVEKGRVEWELIWRPERQGE